MSLSSVKDQFLRQDLPLEVIEMDTSTATVALAAAALGVEPARIAKTMALRLKDEDVLVLACGDARLDNRKFKDAFGEKPRFIGAEDLEAATGHSVGGVCPFGLSRPLRIFLDETLRAYDIVYPAGGGAHTAVRIGIGFLAEVTRAAWVDVCVR